MYNYAFSPITKKNYVKAACLRKHLRLKWSSLWYFVIEFLEIKISEKSTIPAEEVYLRGIHFIWIPVSTWSKTVLE